VVSVFAGVLNKTLFVLELLHYGQFIVLMHLIHLVLVKT